MIHELDSTQNEKKLRDPDSTTDKQYWETKDKEVRPGI